MKLLDTSFVVALLDRKDVLHAEAMKLKERFQYEEFGIIEPILAETYTVIQRRAREKKVDCKVAIEKVEEFERLVKVYKVSFSKYHKEIVERMKRSDLNYNDWLLFFFAKEKQMEIITLDKKLREMKKDKD
ncbi:MAG: PIN domain-containing protein [Candidatus Desulfofervidus auxilii]|nr:PIN domain-containing protein [Candidatus Desulfofervidus auxilii]